MRNLLISLLAVAAFAAPAVVGNVRIDRPRASESGTLLVDVGNRVLSVATGVVHAWPVISNSAVLYSRQHGAGEEQIRLFDAPSTLSRTIATISGEAVDLIQDTLPDSHWAFILTVKKDAEGTPALAIVTDSKGLVFQEDFAAPGTLANGMLQVRRYTKEEIQRTRGDLQKAQPWSIDNLAIARLVDRRIEN